MPSPVNIHTATDDHYMVHLGGFEHVVDAYREPVSYAFPTLQAARTFANAHQDIRPDREVYITFGEETVE